MKPTEYSSKLFVICRPNSGQTKTDHFKFTVELLWALLIEHGCESQEIQGHHSADKNVPQLVERHFPERIPPTEKRLGQHRGV
jgi:hypothetical protein